MTNQPSILVIDDETCICDSCDRLFSQSGYKVDTNVNPDQGFHQALVNHYDAIILDLKLGEKDGIQLLYGIREKNPDVPVVIITGYPTQESRQLSEKLGVSDYILKPFEPDEILASIKRITLKDFSTSKEEVVVQESVVIEPHYRFYKSSWFQQLSENTVRTGGHLPLSGTDIESVRLPDTGDIIYRGLPLAEISLSDYSSRVILSAVTGKITEVNTQLKEFPYLLEISVNEQSWIATVRTDNLKQDLELSETRKILLLSKKQTGKKDYSTRFTYMGYLSRNAGTMDEAEDILRREKIKVVVINAVSFLKDGPELVKRMNREFPGTAIIVFNESGSAYENQYRQNKIFYYGVSPVAGSEMEDILLCAFQDQKKAGAFQTGGTGFLPNAISKVRMTNRYSRKVSLLAYDDILQNNRGTGSLLIRQLHDQLFPLEITHTRSKKSLSDAAEAEIIAKEKENIDRIILIQAGDMNKIPGSIIKDTREYRNSNGSGNRIITITVQPARNENEQDSLDTITSEAMADILSDEMTSR